MSFLFDAYMILSAGQNLFFCLPVLPCFISMKTVENTVQNLRIYTLTNGLLRISSANVDIGPWPGMKAVAPPRGHNFSLIEVISV